MFIFIYTYIYIYVLCVCVIQTPICLYNILLGKTISKIVEDPLPSPWPIPSIHRRDLGSVAHPADLPCARPAAGEFPGPSGAGPWPAR